MMHKFFSSLLFFFVSVGAITISNTVWNTNWNVMYFWQDGNQVHAEYMYDGGFITGTLNGDTLRGWWREHNNAIECGPENNWSGPLLFKFSADGKSFTGSWGYCATDPLTLDPNGGSWTGTIKDGVVAYTQEECENAGRFWCNNECSLVNCNSAVTKEACENAGRFWCSDSCKMSPCNTSTVREPRLKRPAADVKRSFNSSTLSDVQFNLRGKKVTGKVNGISIFIDGSGKSYANVSIKP